MLEGSGLDNVKILYVTHLLPLMFDLLGEAKLKKLEEAIQNIPVIKTFGGA